MSKFDFIPENNQVSENHVEDICKCILRNMNTSIYDGRNVYAKAVAVCRNRVTGGYEWEDRLKEKEQIKLFYPTTDELKAAMAVFKEKGYHPYYDKDVCFYRVAKDVNEVQGRHAIANTIWL